METQETTDSFIIKKNSYLERREKDPITVMLVITDSDGTVVLFEYVGGGEVHNILSSYSCYDPDRVSTVPHFSNPVDKICYTTTDVEFINSISGILALYSDQFTLSDFIKIIDAPYCIRFNFIVSF